MKSFALKSISPQAHQFDNPEYRFKLLAGIAFSTNRWICSKSNRLCRNLLMVGPINPGPMYSPIVFPFHCRSWSLPFPSFSSNFEFNSFDLSFSIFCSYSFCSFFFLFHCRTLTSPLPSFGSNFEFNSFDQSFSIFCSYSFCSFFSLFFLGYAPFSSLF